MKNYLIFNSSTDKVFTLESSTDDSTPVLDTDYNFIELKPPIYPIERYYVSHHEAKVKPSPPDTLSVFNEMTEQWDYSPELYRRQIESEKEGVLYNRLQLLQASDWTDTVSAVGRLGESKYQEWQIYRQALRDIPQQSGFPLNVIYPTPPN